MSLPAVLPRGVPKLSKRRTPRADHDVRLRLWLPLTPLWLLLGPVVVLAFPLIALACLPWRLNPFALVGALGQLLLSLSGTQVEIEAPGASIRIHIL
jgi:hypothetical protein